MLLDRLQLRIDDRAAVEGADRQRERQRLDQKPHADGRAAGGDGEADAGLVQLLHRALWRASVSSLSLVSSVPSTSETTSAIRVMAVLVSSSSVIQLPHDVVDDRLDRMRRSKR